MKGPGTWIPYDVEKKANAQGFTDRSGHINLLLSVLQSHVQLAILQKTRL